VTHWSIGSSQLWFAQTGSSFLLPLTKLSSLASTRSMIWCRVSPWLPSVLNGYWFSAFCTT